MYDNMSIQVYYTTKYGNKNSKWFEMPVDYDAKQAVTVYQPRVFGVADLPEVVVNVFGGLTVNRDVFVHMIGAYAMQDKIGAIKIVRQVTYWGLKEAKDFVESL